MTQQNNNAPSNGQTPNDGDPTGQTPTPTPNGQTPNGRTSIDSLPQDIQELISTLRNENKEKRETLKAQETARQQQEQEELRKQGEFQKLAEQHEQRVKELEPTVERYTKLSDIVNEQIKAEVKDWPAEIKDLLPDKSAPVEDRLKSLEKLRPLVERLNTQARGQTPGNVPNPKPSSDEPGTDVNDYYKRYRASGLAGKM